METALGGADTLPPNQAQATYSIQQAPLGTNASDSGRSLEKRQGEEVPALLELTWNKEVLAGFISDLLGLHLGVIRNVRCGPFLPCPKRNGEVVYWVACG